MGSGEADSRHLGPDFRGMTVRRYVAIAGIPGSGKTTLARGLGAMGWTVVSTGDIARRIDPAALEQGRLADGALFAAAFMDTVADLGDASAVVFDGLPRYASQLSLLPRSTTIIGLWCRRDIALDRLLRRKRADDTDEIIKRRLDEQIPALSGLHDWTPWGHVANTSLKQPGEILAGVIGVLNGSRREIF